MGGGIESAAMGRFGTPNTGTGGDFSQIGQAKEAPKRMPWNSISISANVYAGCSVDLSVYFDEFPKDQKDVGRKIANEYLKYLGLPKDIDIDEIVKKHYSAYLI